MRLLLAISLVVVTMQGCSCAQEAPAGMDNIARFVFDRVPPAEGLELDTQETELRDAIARMREEFAAGNVAVDTPLTVILDDLAADNVAGLPGIDDRLDKLGLAQGMAIANITPCTQQHMVTAMTSELTPVIHPEVYESYGKSFDGDTQTFRDGSVDALTWTTTYKILQPPVGSAYATSLQVMGRRIPASDGEGEIIVNRLHMPQPGVFDGDGSSFELDFQMEIWFDQPDNTRGHFYAMWRRMVLGPVDSQNGLFIDTTLNGFKEFEARVDQACLDGMFDG